MQTSHARGLAMLPSWENTENGSKTERTSVGGGLLHSHWVYVRTQLYRPQATLGKQRIFSVSVMLGCALALHWRAYMGLVLPSLSHSLLSHSLLSHSLAFPPLAFGSTLPKGGWVPLHPAPSSPFTLHPSPFTRLSTLDSRLSTFHFPLSPFSKKVAKRGGRSLDVRT